jgi:hypothetical protein
MPTLEERVKQGEKIRAGILKYYRQGLTPKQIREMLGISVPQYAYHSKLLRAEGKIKTGNTKVDAPEKMFFVRLGSVSEVFDNTDADVRQWAVAQTNKYDSVAEFLRDCMLDQYYDEHE